MSTFKPKNTWPTFADPKSTIEALRADRLEPATVRTYATGARAWLHFCNLHIYPLYPSLFTLEHFITTLTHASYAYNSITSYLSGIGDWIARESLDRSAWESLLAHYRIKILLESSKKYIARLRPNGTVRKAAISRLQIEELYFNTCAGGDYDSYLFFTIVAVGFHGLFRLGELVLPDTKAQQMLTKVLMRHTTECDWNYVKLYLPYMKNDRFYQGNTVILQKRSGVSDPTVVMRVYLAKRDAAFGNSPFLFMRSNGDIPTRRWFLGRFRQHFPENYSGHSLRSGGATMLASTGASALEVQLAGRWTSDAFLSYLRKNPEIGLAMQR